MRTAEKILRLMLALVRELGDESAYRRHLAYHRRQHSKEEWQRFHETRFRKKYEQAKCC